MSASVDEQQQQQQPSRDNDTKFWNEQWVLNKIGFHRLNVNERFRKYVLSKLMSTDQQQCVLFPLCGKTIDMKAVLDAKHQVIGMDCAPLGIEAFFQENNIKYNVENNKDGQIYKGIDHPITIYCTDFLTFNQPLPIIDWIWDRGSLVAISIADREQYRDTILRLMTPNHTRYYIVANNYDVNELTGPPHRLSDDDVNHLFGSTCSVELIEISDITEEFNASKEKKIQYMEERLHLVIRK